MLQRARRNVYPYGLLLGSVLLFALNIGWLASPEPAFTEGTLTTDTGVSSIEQDVSLPFVDPDPPELYSYSLRVSLTQGWFSPTRLRIVPDDCVTALSVGGVDAPLTAISEQQLCDYGEGFAIDLGQVLHRGENTLIVNFINKGGAAGISLRYERSPVWYEGISLLSTALLLAACGMWAVSLARSGLLRWPPGISRREAWWMALACGLMVIALAKAPFLYDMSDDYKNWVQGWFSYIKAHGVFHAYADRFSNYTPFYTYMLGLAALLTPDSVTPLIPVKLINFAGEALASVAVYRLVCLRYGKDSFIPLLAALLLPLLPTVMMNGTSAGQCDIWYVAFLLWAIYYFAVERAGMAMLWVALACAFKLQGAMLAPLVIALFLRGRIAWPYLLLIPLVYLGLAVPCLWEGRPLLSLLLIYKDQFFTYSGLAMNSANLYWLIPNQLYAALLPYGIVLSALLALAYALRTAPKLRRDDVSSLLLAAALGAALLFYTMPKMHERYLFPSEIMVFILIVMRPKLWPVAVLFQLASVISYLGFFSQYRYLLPVTYETAMLYAVLANALGIAMLGYAWFRLPDATAAESGLRCAAA